MAGLTTPPTATAEPTNRILMIVRDDSRDQDLMLEQEVFVMKRLIEAEGYSVDVATINDEPLTGAVSLNPDLSLGEIDFQNYDGLMLPCMAAEPQKTMPDAIVRLIAQADANALPIGAMRGSVRELARAGALDGLHCGYAAQVDLAQNPEFSNAIYDGTGITTDGRITTAGICPLAAKVLGEADATTALTQAFLDTVSSRGDAVTTSAKH